ncbi:AraC family transcriptional regulator [Actinoplanes sp. CA-030573]|uniref:AraC family transcriptional regulator n=1 Tax=Actinoplanes sp. CA-030573 TaxID=3239898 RepID=UPI003D8D2BF8
MTQPEWLEVRTRDKQAIAEALNSITAHRARIAIDDGDRLDLQVRMANSGALGAARVRLCGVSYGADTDPVDFLLAGSLADGRTRIRAPGQELALTRSDGYLFPLGVPVSGEYGNSSIDLVTLPLSYAAELAEATTGLPAADLRFESPQPLSTSMRLYWAATVAYLADQLTRPEADLPPLVRDQMTRLAAATLLATFPNTTMTARLPREGRVAPAAIRRAIAYMDTHPERPLTITEVAAAAGVGARALQSAFRRHLDVTPMGYLRRVRLERVHRELQTADPADGATVRATAHRWGFANPSRFAADYRAAFGQPPSRTLRT